MDTETVGGKAVLVTAAGPGDKTAFLEFPRTFRAIFEFLVALADRFMAYNMDYDARAWFKFLSPTAWADLYRRKSILWRGFQIAYQEGKYFLVRRGRRSVTLFDCCQHYQSSLAVAMRSTLGREKHDIPKTWYGGMADCLKDSRRSKVLAYALEDSRGCRDLWSILDAQYRKLGVDAHALARPLSPGQIAAGFFGDKIRFRLDREHNDSARRGYRGGRIEVYRRGFFPTVYAYDLKSAYPWSLSGLPDPRSAEFVESGEGEIRRDVLYSVYTVIVDIPTGVLIPPTPVFVKGKGGPVLTYPVGRFLARVTGPELMLLKREGWLREILYGVHLEGERRAWRLGIPALFRLRKKRPEISTAIKLVLNSVYGKLAQQRDTLADAGIITTGTRRLGGAWVSTFRSPGRTTNFFVAAYVTALVRIRLWETMRDVGFENCILSATDGLVTTKPLPRGLVGVGNLGDWVPAFQGAGMALVVGTGVYSLHYAGAWHDKVRGFRPLSPLREMLKTSRTRIRVKNRVAYTLGDFALHGSELNDMVEINRTLDVNFDRKRSWPRPWKSARSLLRSNQSSEPLIYLESR
jgi:hypothetical protein